jgi:chromosome segregation ATPase
MSAGARMEEVAERSAHEAEAAQAEAEAARAEAEAARAEADRIQHEIERLIVELGHSRDAIEARADKDGEIAAGASSSWSSS